MSELKDKYGFELENEIECQHPNFFFKEFKFYCRTCGKEQNERCV